MSKTFVYVIRENGDEYATLGTDGEAQKYLEDLRKVYPMEDWEVVPTPLGRLPGQGMILWGAECVVNLLTLEIHQWTRLYLWESQVVNPKLPEFGVEYFIYYPLQLRDTYEADGAKTIKRLLGGLKFESVNDSTVRRIR